jgi:Spy/CpxP family protein refolding chaperone
MKKTRKTMTLLIAAMLLMPLTLSAQADADAEFFGHQGMGQMGMHGGGDGGGHGAGIGRLLAMGDELGLTDDQRDKIESLMTDHKLTQIDRRAAMQKAKVQLHVLMRDDDASESAVLKQIDKLSDLRADMQKSKYTHRKSIHSVLTAEQLDKVKKLKKSHGKRGGKFGQAGRGCEQGEGKFGRGGHRGGRCGN